MVGTRKRAFAHPTATAGLSPHVVEVLRYLGDRQLVDFDGRWSMIMCTGVGGAKGRRGSGRRQHVGHGQTIGIAGAAVHRDIVASDIGGVGVHLLGGSSFGTASRP